MEDVKNTICKFCFQLINEDISSISIDTVRIMVKCLLPDNDISESPVICHSCLINLQSAYNFMKTANENNLKILDATIENDDDLCQTCLKPVENTHVYLYDRFDNIAPLSLITRMLECSLIFLNLEYRRYPVMCDDCWKILKVSYSFLMCCVQNEMPLYQEHNYTLFSECNLKLRDVTPDQKERSNHFYDIQTSMENILSNLKTEMEEPITIKQELKAEAEDTMEQYQCFNKPLIEISDTININQENENANISLKNVPIVDKFEIEDNFDQLEMVEDCDIKLFEEMNTTGYKFSQNSCITENRINSTGETSVKTNQPDFKKKLYIKLERLVLEHKKGFMEGTEKCLKIYICHVCSYITKKKYKHTRHISTHMTLEDFAKNNDLYKCNNCNYITKLKYSLRRHIKQVHRCIYVCQECDYETNETETYNLHLKLQHNNNLIAYNCELCSFSCCTKLQLKHHVRTHDLDKIILKCSQCTFETKQVLVLDNHLMSHKNMRISKLYKCEICAYQVKKKSGISRHILTHTNKKELSNSNILHRCHECDYTTKRKDSLAGHIRIRHKNTNEKTKRASIKKMGKNS